MGIVDSPLSTFCQKLKESLDHQFIHCAISIIAFWLSVVERPMMHVTGILLILQPPCCILNRDIDILYQYILA